MLIPRVDNRAFSCSRYWTGTSLQVRLVRGVLPNANVDLVFTIFPMSLHYKLVPVQYREYKYGLFQHILVKFLVLGTTLSFSRPYNMLLPIPITPKVLWPVKIQSFAVQTFPNTSALQATLFYTELSIILSR